jgi:hypothetical protein
MHHPNPAIQKTETLTLGALQEETYPNITMVNVHEKI